MSLPVPYDRCFGCMACKAVCPVSAIVSKMGDDGFYYPMILPELCMECGACRAVCASSFPAEQSASNRQRYFAVMHRDPKVILKSSSGGAFSAVSDWILIQRGVVYGAAYDMTFKVYHSRTQTPRERDALSGSKYIQSDLNGIYQAVEKDLADGRKVLFTGTPCQCAAIRQYLIQQKADTRNLYIADIFCHGVLSPGVWTMYLRWLQERFGGDIQYLSMRDKAAGWRNKHMKAVVGGRDVSRTCNRRHSILRLYESNVAFRASCYQCPYHSLDRVGDISIGDFWGVERQVPSFDRNNGVTALIVSTQKQKGNELLRAISAVSNIREVQRHQILQQALCTCTQAGKGRTEYLRIFRNGNSHTLHVSYFRYSAASIIKRDIIIPFLYKTRLLRMASTIKHCLKTLRSG